MEAPELERRLAAILAADVEGYSRLMHGDEEATMATLSARRGVVDELIARHRGRIANTAGDGVLAEFVSVLDAVRCAVEIQETLERVSETEPGARQMRFRIGVNVAARLEGLVRGGEICISRGVCDHLHHRGGMIFEDLGEQLVKNIVHPIRAFRLRISGEASEQEALTSADTAAPPAGVSAPEANSEPSADSEVALELAFWNSVEDGSPTELATYLERYPDGSFAALARTRLDAAAVSPPSPAGTTAEVAPDPLDLAFWDSVKDSDRREELQAYLEQHPNGHFAGLARARLASPEGA